MNLLQDIRTAANVFGAVRRARKEGASAVQVKPVYTVPQAAFGPAYANTIEGCLTWKCGREADRAVREVFKSLPYETQRQLEFSPQEPGEWVERARFWQRQLRPVLPPRTYCSVITQFLEWYIHCLRRRSEAAV